MLSTCAPSRMRYNPAHVQKKHIGCESPFEHCDESRSTARIAAFSFRAPVMAARMGGRKPYRFTPVLTGLSHPFVAAAICESLATVVFTEQLESNIMTNALTPFNFGQSAIRTTTVGDAVWFSAADVCDVLGIKNHRESLRHLDDDEKGVISNDTLGGQQKISVVNESGLYALVLRSRKPEARKFAKWVTSEVLPAIRKTGSYSAAPAEPLPSLQMRRWLISYDHTGAEQVQSVPIDAAIISPSRGDDVHAFLGEMLPTALIPEALATLTGRIARALHVPKATSTAVKKIG